MAAGTGSRDHTDFLFSTCRQRDGIPGPLCGVSRGSPGSQLFCSNIGSLGWGWGGGRGLLFWEQILLES